jgi:ankyrin repeat protein
MEDDEYGDQALLNELVEAAMRRNIRKVRLLVERDRRLLNAAFPDGRTALLFAANYGRLEETRYMLDEGAQLTHHVFCSACSGGHTNVISLCLERGADIDAWSEGGSTPLQAAVLGGFKENVAAVSLLLAHGCRDLDHRTLGTDGRTALFQACCNGRTPEARLLLAAGADPRVPTFECFGARLPLQVALEYEREDCVAVLHVSLDHCTVL